MRRVALGAALLVAAAAPSSASAALDFQPCASPQGVQCATIDVPVDRSGAVPGTFTLLVHRVPAPQPTGKPPLFYLTGGPGQTNTAVTRRAVVRYGAALQHRDLITFAQRGTGPTSITCAALEQGQDPATAVPACADQLGPARNFYTSRDAADDIDAIRQALGVDKIALFGASYGTWVEQGYAIRHPEHVETMVLDSTIGPNQRSDPFGVEEFKAAPGVARALCHRNACRGMTKDLYADFLKLFAKLQKTPLAGKVVDANGKVRKVTVLGLVVASLVPDLDVNKHLRAELPRAVVGALKGDSGPLARLVAGGPSGPPPDPLQAINQTLLNVTRCEEDVPPFDRTASPADRLTQAHQQLAAIPPSSFDPFGPDIAFLLSLVPTCAYWPMLPAQPGFGAGAPPDVPVLFVHGEFDLRSTLSSTQLVASEFPQATVLTIPNAGHSATRRAAPNCARTAVIDYLNSASPVQCKPGADPFVARPLAPKSLGAVKPVGIGLRGRSGRAVYAAQLTVRDAFDQLDVGSGGRPSLESKVRGGGLRGGTFHGTKNGLVLNKYEFVKGFPVTGAVRPKGAVVLKIPHGSLRFTGGEVTGKLPGTQFGATAKLQRRTIGAQLGNQAP
jgi:pimeloyl-ACP methyl ester carboxylesterase